MHGIECNIEDEIGLTVIHIYESACEILYQFALTQGKDIYERLRPRQRKGAEIKKADKIILPGVGAFADAKRKLDGQGLSELICEQAAEGKDIMGICLGMQMLFEKSYEREIRDYESMSKHRKIDLD